MAEDLVGEHLVSVEKALQRYGKGHRRRVTFGPVCARLFGKKNYRWYVACARRFAGNWKYRGWRALVDGPFPTKAAAAVRCRELRNMRCERHDDCRACQDLGRACFQSTAPPSSNTEDSKR